MDDIVKNRIFNEIADVMFSYASYAGAEHAVLESHLRNDLSYLFARFKLDPRDGHRDILELFDVKEFDKGHYGVPSYMIKYEHTRKLIRKPKEEKCQIITKLLNRKKPLPQKRK